MRGAGGLALLILLLALAALVAPHAPQSGGGSGGGSNGGGGQEQPRNIVEWIELRAGEEPDGVVAERNCSAWFYSPTSPTQPPSRVPVDVTVRVGFNGAAGEPVVRVVCLAMPQGRPPSMTGQDPRWWHGVGASAVAVYFNTSTGAGGWGPFELRVFTDESGAPVLVGHARVLAGPPAHDPQPGRGTWRVDVAVVVAWSRDWLGAKPPGLVGVSELTGPSLAGVYYFYVKNEHKPVIQDLWQRAPGLDVPDRDDPDYLVVVYKWVCASKTWAQLGVVEPGYELKWFQYVVEPGCQARVRAEAYAAGG